MNSRELVYKTFHGENTRPPIHIEADNKDFEVKYSDIIGSRIRIKEWDNFFTQGGPFRKLNGESLRDWITRIEQIEYDWTSIIEKIPETLDIYRAKVNKLLKYDRFFLLKILGPTETSEGFFVTPPTKRLEGSLAHRFMFAVLCRLNSKLAFKIYDSIAKVILHLLKAALDEFDFVDGVRIADDCASYTGFIYPSALLNRYLEWHDKFTRVIKRKGKYAIIHTDGDIRKGNIIHKLARCYHGFHPLDIAPKTTVQNALTWVDEIAKLRHEIPERVFFTGLPIELIFNDNISVNDFLRVVSKVIEKLDNNFIVMATTHSPYPGHGYWERKPFEKVVKARELIINRCK